MLLLLLLLLDGSGALGGAALLLLLLQQLLLGGGGALAGGGLGGGTLQLLKLLQLGGGGAAPAAASTHHGARRALRWCRDGVRAGRCIERAAEALAWQAAAVGPGKSRARDGSCSRCAGSSAGAALRHSAPCRGMVQRGCGGSEGERARRTVADGLGGCTGTPASDTAPQQPAAARLRRSRAAWSASWVLSGRSSYLPLN